MIDKVSLFKRIKKIEKRIRKLENKDTHLTSDSFDDKLIKAMLDRQDARRIKENREYLGARAGIYTAGADLYEAMERNEKKSNTD